MFGINPLLMLSVCAHQSHNTSTSDMQHGVSKYVFNRYIVRAQHQTGKLNLPIYILYIYIYILLVGIWLEGGSIPRKLRTE
jgi:hypothetical protein